jgi:ATP-dependent helicase/nuclease subunit A
MRFAGGNVNAPRIIPSDVLAHQIRASDPGVSAWVAANAGSGKTHVLAQRVIRVLLDGALPEKILCITFTKAAAANMAKRVFDTLAKWTTLDDMALDGAIIATSGLTPNTDIRAQARRLFAQTIETPGGLKVQTIHAFCTRLLHQFPFEANVAARFEVLDSVAEARLLEEVSVGVLLDAAAHPDSLLGRSFVIALDHVADQTFKQVIGEAIRKRDLVRKWVDETGSIENAIAGLCAGLTITSDDSIERVDTETTEGPYLPSSRWTSVVAVLSRGSKTEQEQAERLVAARELTGEGRAEIYSRIFLTDKGDPRKVIITKTLAKEHPALAQDLEAERDRIVALKERRKAIACRDRTAALVTVAAAVIDRYQTEKDQRALLDYNDLIDRALDLLERVDSAWVHYKLDRGIDHVLIDEAQDTSPKQWRIIKALTAEFFVGAGARLLRRTVFAVGDEKQSIFSFQGAAPREFDAMRRTFTSLCAAAEHELRYVPFRRSFRSGPNVLSAVDKVFERPEAFNGLSTDNVKTVHEWLPDARPGIVEIWDVTKPDDKPDIEAWDAPFDTVNESSPQSRLAQRIARNVAQWQREGARPGDVLILVRQRGSLFESIIRSLKDAGIAVAGADRLVLTEHIAVMDLMALADALLLPEDDLALATVLKSPLFGFNDQDLFDIAWRRKGSLRTALRSQARADFAAASATLDRMAVWARRDLPFAFFARVLGRERGRERMLARLGAEATDALDEFLNLALDYETREPPSLQGFIARLRSANAEIKRDMEIARDEVRVMTVHGAKGLEAPIVILGDTTSAPSGPTQRHARLLVLPGAGAKPDQMAWAAARASDVAPLAKARERARAEIENEHRRLLYVAMTRAIDRLVVCGFDSKRTRPLGCWYDLVFTALAPLSLCETNADGQVWRYGASTAGIGAPPTKPQRPGTLEPLPDWLMSQSRPELRRLVPLTPSGAYEETTAVRSSGANLARKKALARGDATHRLLQSLPDIPREARDTAARQHLERTNEFDADEREFILEQVFAILDDPRFSVLFSPGSRAEVPIVGRLRLGGSIKAVSGQVDRLVVTADRVLIADYKTNRPAPARIDDVPRAYTLQLALYRAVLARLYPGHSILAVLIWTDVPDLMEISGPAMDQALDSLSVP